MIAIVSILENNKGTACSVYVLTDSLNNKNRELFSYLSDYYKQRITVTEISAESFNNLKVRSRYPKSMYYRFLLPDLIADTKVLYLDCDIIVRKPLSAFYNTDLTDIAAAVVEDAQGDDILLHNRIRYSGKYFNSGVMLINLDYWRDNCIKDTLVDFILKNPDRCFYPDQDALNIVLENGVKFVDYGNNCQELWFTKLDRLQFSFTKFSAVIDAIKDPVIVHYTSTLKPWFYECKHPHQDWFLEYAFIHPILGIKLKRKFGFFRTLVSRVLEWIVYRVQTSSLIIHR